VKRQNYHDAFHYSIRIKRVAFYTFGRKAMRASVQHEGARKLLAVLRVAKAGDEPLTYASMAERIGRPRKDARAVAQMCDLLDAAAAYSRTPLLALTAVLAGSGKVNPKAWAGPGIPSTLRDAIVEQSLKWRFSREGLHNLRCACVM
jgi:hypothetical protein